MKPVSIVIAVLVLLGLSVEVMATKSSAEPQQMVAQNNGPVHRADVVILPLPRQ